MANQIITTNIRPIDGYVSGSSRYANSAIIYYGSLHKITFPTYRRKSIIPSENDMFMVIPGGLEYRPDLVSKEMYGSVDFWWRILEMNGMTDIFQFKSGVNIRLPSNVYGI